MPNSRCLARNEVVTWIVACVKKMFRCLRGQIFIGTAGEKAEQPIVFACFAVPKLILACDLEADGVSEVLRVPADRNHGEEVDKGSAVFPEVENVGLELVVCLDSLAHALDGLLGNVLPGRLLADLSAGGLKEAAVLAKNLAVLVTGEDAEVFGSVDNRAIGLFEVTKKQSNRTVNCAEFNLGVGPSSDTELMFVNYRNRQHQS